MNRSSFLAIICIGGLAFLAGCGDGVTRSPAAATSVPATPSPSPTAEAAASGPDTALATSMLMTRDDFAFDYLERRRDDTKDPFSSCRGGAGSSTGGASTGDWLFDGQSPAITETVTVFATQDDALAYLDTAPASVACALKAINEGHLDEANITLSDAISSPISVDAGGDRYAAFQLRAKQTFAGQNAGGTAQYTQVFIAKERAVVEILVRGTGAPFDHDELVDIAVSAVARMQPR